MISDWYPSFSRCKSPQYRRTRCIYFCFPKIVFHQQVYPLRTVTEFIECKKKKKKYSRTTSFFVMLYGCRNDLKSNRDVDRKPNPSAQSSEQRPGGGVAPYVYISAIIEKGKPESFLSSSIPPSCEQRAFRISTSFCTEYTVPQLFSHPMSPSPSLFKIQRTRNRHEK